MLIVLSHALAFSSLFLGSIFDLKTTEVPDPVSLVGVLGGISLHFMASLNSGFDIYTLTNFSLILQNPVSWLQAFGDPLLWCLGVGMIFSIYGWGLYFLGLWGGADAFAMSVLGFAAPYSITGFGVLHGINLFLNIMIAGFIYTLGFAFYKAAKTPEVWRKTWNQLKQQERRISLEIIGAGLIGFLGEYTSAFNGLFYFGFFVLLILLYRFLNNVQDDLLSQSVDVSSLVPGDVIEEDIDLGTHQVREKNILGRFIGLIRSIISIVDISYLESVENRLMDLENRAGYPEIVGVTEEQINELQSRDIQEVEVKEGVRFIPVFPVALVMTDVFGIGVVLLQLLVS